MQKIFEESKFSHQFFKGERGSSSNIHFIFLALGGIYLIENKRAMVKMIWLWFFRLIFQFDTYWSKFNASDYNHKTCVLNPIQYMHAEFDPRVQNWGLIIKKQSYDKTFHHPLSYIHSFFWDFKVLKLSVSPEIIKQSLDFTRIADLQKLLIC